MSDPNSQSQTQYQALPQSMAADSQNNVNILIEKPFPEKKRSGFHFSITIVCSIFYMIAAAKFLDTFPTTEAKIKCAIFLFNITMVALCCLVLSTPDYPSPLKYAYKLILSFAFVYAINVMFMAFLVE